MRPCQYYDRTDTSIYDDNGIMVLVLKISGKRLWCCHNYNLVTTENRSQAFTTTVHMLVVLVAIIPLYLLYLIVPSNSYSNKAIHAI